MVSENAVYLFDVILLYIVRMRIWQPEKPFGEVTYNCMLMQKFLIVVSLGQELLFGS